MIPIYDSKYILWMYIIVIVVQPIHVNRHIYFLSCNDLCIPILQMI